MGFCIRDLCMSKINQIEQELPKGRGLYFLEDISYLQNHIHVDICNQIMTMRSLEIGHLMTSSFGVICSQMSSPFCKQPSVSKLTPFCFHPVLTAFSLVGQALTLLVAVSSMCYHTSTPALSTSSSSRGFTPFGWDISS